MRTSIKPKAEGLEARVLLSLQGAAGPAVEPSAWPVGMGDVAAEVGTVRAEAARAGSPGVAGDFDGDGRTDLAIFDETYGLYWVEYSSGGELRRAFGDPSHVNVPVSGDFDGDGRADLALYDETDARFYVALSSGGGVIVSFGDPSHVNVPVGGDYDGDGRTDLTLYDESDARFYIARSTSGGLVVPFGDPGHVNIPVVGDYDGDGRTDLGIYDMTYVRFRVAASGGGAYDPGLGYPEGHSLPLPSGFPAGLLAVLPFPGDYPSLEGWMGLHNVDASEALGHPFRAVVLGDSITSGWTVSQAWATRIAPLRVAGFGIPGDETHEILWRIRHGELAGRPRVAVVEIGVNNLNDHQTPAEVALGIVGIVDAIRDVSPTTKILLLAVLPSVTIPTQGEAVNRLLGSVVDGKTVVLVNLGPYLLRPDGSVNRDLLPDGIHPNEAGYQVLTRALLGPLKALLRA